MTYTPRVRAKKLLEEYIFSFERSAEDKLSEERIDEIFLELETLIQDNSWLSYWGIFMFIDIEKTSHNVLEYAATHNIVVDKAELKRGLLDLVAAKTANKANWRDEDLNSEFEQLSQRLSSRHLPLLGCLDSDHKFDIDGYLDRAGVKSLVFVVPTG